MEEILILDDDYDFCEMVGASLEELGAIKTFQKPQTFLKYFNNEAQNIKLILIDFNLQDKHMSGFDVIKKIKSKPNSHLIPILMVSGADDIYEQAYNSGIDDYIQKPIIPHVFSKKVEHLLFNTNQKLHMNPLTGLPGNFMIEQEYNKRKANQSKYSVAYIDMDHFKGFNDEKGVKKGDQAIQLLANILNQYRIQYSKDDLFVAHLGGDDFFLIGSPIVLPEVIHQCYDVFSKEIHIFFTKKEIYQKYYMGKNREGKKIKIDLLSLSTAIIHIHTTNNITELSFNHFSEKASILKKQAKKIAGNSLVIEKFENII